MEGFEITEKEEQLLNLSLSIDLNTKRKKNKNRHDHDHDQGEIFRLLQLREQMLRLEKNTRSSSMVQVADQEDGNKGLYLIHLLLKSATSVDSYNFSSAMADLGKIYQNISLTGNSAQRVASYFADGLTARLIKEKSPYFHEIIMKNPTSSEEFLAFTHLYRVSPCYQFSHFTANQAILEAFETEEETQGLHVIDFDLAYGFQWPSLIQSLSEKATATETIIPLRITGFARSLGELVETETRLLSFSKGFRNIVFEFQGLLRGSKLIHNIVKRRENETLAVNLVSCLHSSRNNTLKISNTLKSIHSLNPSITILVQQGGEDNGISPSFLENFMDSLHYYAAIFDSLDDCLPRDNLERLCIERNHLGKEIKNTIVNWFGDDKVMVSDEKKCGVLGWKEMMESNGFWGRKLSSRTTMQARLLLRMRSHCQPQVKGDNGGFRVFEGDNGKAISLGWQDRVLVTASAWECV